LDFDLVTEPLSRKEISQDWHRKDIKVLLSTPKHVIRTPEHSSQATHLLHQSNFTQEKTKPREVEYIAKITQLANCS
jgi:hypothetical protein